MSYKTNMINNNENDNSFHDGFLFCKLIEAFDPTLIDFKTLQPNNPAHNLNVAFDIAERFMGIEKMLDPQDFCSPDPANRPDEQCIITYLSHFPVAFLKRQTPTALSPADFKIQPIQPTQSFPPPSQHSIGPNSGIPNQPGNLPPHFNNPSALPSSSIPPNTNNNISSHHPSGGNVPSSSTGGVGALPGTRSIPQNNNVMNSFAPISVPTIPNPNVNPPNLNNNNNININNQLPTTLTSDKSSQSPFGNLSQHINAAPQSSLPSFGNLSNKVNVSGSVSGSAPNASFGNMTQQVNAANPQYPPPSSSSPSSSNSRYVINSDSSAPPTISSNPATMGPTPPSIPSIPPNPFSGGGGSMTGNTSPTSSFSFAPQQPQPQQPPSTSPSASFNPQSQPPPLFDVGTPPPIPNRQSRTIDSAPPTMPPQRPPPPTMPFVFTAPQPQGGSQSVNAYPSAASSSSTSGGQLPSVPQYSVNEILEREAELRAKEEEILKMQEAFRRQQEELQRETERLKAQASSNNYELENQMLQQQLNTLRQVCYSPSKCSDDDM